MKRTLKRELKVPEIVKRETIETTIRAPGTQSERRGTVVSRGCPRAARGAAAAARRRCTFLACGSASIPGAADGRAEGGRETTSRPPVLQPRELGAAGIEESERHASRRADCRLRVAAVRREKLSPRRRGVHRGRRALCRSDAGVYGFKRPVLKHGPRSLTRVRVLWWQARMRNESKGRLGRLRCDPRCLRRGAASTDLELLRKI